MIYFSLGVWTVITYVEAMRRNWGWAAIGLVFIVFDLSLILTGGANG